MMNSENEMITLLVRSKSSLAWFPSLLIEIELPLHLKANQTWR